MDKRVHISRFLIRMGKVLGQYNRIFLLPHGAGPAPCHIPEALSSVKYLSAAGTADALGKAPLFLCQNTVQNQVQLFQKILCIGMDPHVAADRRLFQLLLIYIIDNHISLSGPCLKVIPHLPDAQTASDGEHQVAVLNGKIPRPVPHIACAAHVQRVGIIHDILAVPARNHRNAQLFSHIHEYIMGSRYADAVTRINDRTLCRPYLIYNGTGSGSVSLSRQHLAVFSLSRLVLRYPVSPVLSGPAVSSGLVVSRVKAGKRLCLHKCALDIQGNIQPAGARTPGPGQIKGLLQTVAYPHGIDDHLRIFCHAVNGFTYVKLLVSHGADAHAGPPGRGIIAHLPRQYQHGNRIQPSPHHSGNGIGPSRTRGDAERRNAVVNPGISLSSHGACLLMVVIDTVKPLLVSQAVIQVHGSSPCHHESLADSLLHQLACYIIGNLHFHKLRSPFRSISYGEYSIKRLKIILYFLLQ